MDTFADGESVIASELRTVVPESAAAMMLWLLAPLLELRLKSPYRKLTRYVPPTAVFSVCEITPSNGEFAVELNAAKLVQ